MSKGAVFWHQGLFLQPQHFQCSDIRTEALLGDLAGTVRPWLWGIKEAQIDAGALAAGTLTFSKLCCLFPETGIVLDVPGNAICAGRTIPTDIVPVSDTVDVYLAMGVLRPEGGNAALADSPEGLAALETRYGVLTGQGALPDLYEQGPAAQVREMTVILRIVFGPEKDRVGNSILLPVARLIRGSETFSVDESYAPPCLTLGDSPVLSGIFKEIRDRAIGKTRQMDSYKSIANRNNSGELASLFMILRSLSRFAAKLDFFTDTPLITPWEAYLLLREMVAELSVFSREFNPLGEDASGRVHIPHYDHSDPAIAFQALQKIIVHMIDGLSAGPKYMLRLEAAPPFWQIHLPAHVLENPHGGASFWLLLQSPGSDLTSMPVASQKAIKVGPIDSMSTLLAHAVPGLPFSLEESAPLGLARQGGTLYLALHDDATMWQDIVKQGGLSLDWRDAPADLEAHFVVLGS